ncbi:hypothetical protein CJ030_MR4G021335 [Morella rubra]|uniref:Fe2OG dioxygenase domain-containing protein n=1 Tax=Morella rubra TaxID=262757 RepID=A0A6A1VY57_9ROSI|nr:hypothetical protein CJ030_MR4G021335 [Morella rubra]
MTEALRLPVVDLSSPDRVSAAVSIRQACMEYGFFYLVNAGVEKELFERVFEESKKFFSLPLEEKMRVARKQHRGYTPLYAENLDPASSSKGDSKESFYIGPLEETTTPFNLNQWPSEEVLPSWRQTMESFHRKALSAGQRLLSLIALALNVDEDFFQKVGALDKPLTFLRLLRYPGELGSLDEEIYGASAHSDYGMVTLLATDGVPGLQVCQEKDRQPRVWKNVLHLDGAFIVNIGDMMERWTNCLFRKKEKGAAILLLSNICLLFVGELGSLDEEIYGASAHSDYGMVTLLATDGVPGLQVCQEKDRQPRVWKNVLHLDGAFIVNIGDMMERWTNCLFRSTLHRVMPAGKERYSAAFFLDPNQDCVVECLESCCSESSPARFPPIRSGDYLKERLRLTYAS